MAEATHNVTEFSRIRLKDGVNVLDESSEAGKALAQLFDVTLRQAGAQRIYASHEVEDPANLWLFVDWESSKHRDDYRKSEEHVSHAQSLEAYKDAGCSSNFSKLAALNPFPPEDVLDGERTPVAEVLLAHFPADYDADARAAVTRRVGEFVSDGLKMSRDWRGISCGWSVERDVPVRGGEEQGLQPGVALVALLGWPSVEAHQRFRDTDAFRGAIHHLRGMPGLVKMSTFHVSCRSRAAEGRARPCEDEYHQHGAGCC